MKLLLPDQVYNKVTDIDRKYLEDIGISGILLDLDNTLVPFDKEELAQDFLRWLNDVQKQGFELCLVSNGRPKRVIRFAKQMDIPAVIRAFKPRRSPFLRALKILNKEPNQVAMIGDQLFTDVLGANRIGIHTILIAPLGKKELKTTQIVRKLEQRMLKKFVKQGLLTADSVSNRIGGK